MEEKQKAEKVRNQQQMMREAWGLQMRDKEVKDKLFKGYL